MLLFVWPLFESLSILTIYIGVANTFHMCTAVFLPGEKVILHHELDEGNGQSVCPLLRLMIRIRFLKITIKTFIIKQSL